MKKLGLISDPHAYPEPVAEALSIFKQQQVDAIWCTGDVAGYGEELEQTISLLQKSDCQLIMGNHEIEYLQKNSEMMDSSLNSYLSSLPRVKQQNIEGKTVYMVHASPPDLMNGGIRLLDKLGNVIESEKQSWTTRLSDFEHEVLIVGHTHQVFAEKLGSTLVINPGSSQFNNSCAILSLPDLNVQWFALSGQSIRKSWNWGMELSSY
jgi:putative phosphoesterase